MPIISTVGLGLALTKAMTEEPKTVFPKSLDFSAPTTPGLAAIGVDASKAIQPSNLQELSTTLVNSFDGSGRLQQGFAISSQLSKLGYGPRFVSQKRRFDPSILNREWASNLSIAATKSTETGGEARLAVGLAIPIWDETDWRSSSAAVKLHSAIVEETLESFPEPTVNNLPEALDTLTQLRRIADKPADIAKLDGAIPLLVVAIAPGANQTQIQAAQAALGALVGDESQYWNALITSIFGKKYDEAKAKFLKKEADASWNRRKTDFTIAHSLFARNAQKDSLRSDGTFLALASSGPLGAKGKIVGVVGYGNKDRRYDTDTKVWNTGNSLRYGVGIRSGSGTENFFLEYQYTSYERTGFRTERETIWQGGFESKIGEAQWLQIVLGKGTGASVNRNIFGINLSFSFGTSQQIKAGS